MRPRRVRRAARTGRVVAVTELHDQLADLPDERDDFGRLHGYTHGARVGLLDEVCPTHGRFRPRVWWDLSCAECSAFEDSLPRRVSEDWRYRYD